MAPGSEALRDLAFQYLQRQSWFHVTMASAVAEPLALVSLQVIRDQPPGLARVIVGCGERRFQLLIGWRPSSGLAGALRNEEGALLGAASDAGSPVVVYDALADDELCRVLLAIATDQREQARRVRPVTSLVSHASLVFDERLFMKCYRVLERGSRPEVEVLFGLDQVGFNALMAPVARWRDDDLDLALVREFLPSALEGRLLALTSLRDLLAHGADREEGEFNAVGDATDVESATATAGGDFAAEMVRLGTTTARMHLALAEAFGKHRLSAAALADGLRRRVSPTRPGEAARPSAAARERRIHEIADDLTGEADATGLGRAIRLHGDYHLRRVMRSEVGWLVTGFADDPLYATFRPDPSLPPRTGSALEDVADMSFALGQVAREALAQRSRSERGIVGALADAWARRNRGAFVGGYLSASGIDALLPADARLRDQLIDGFELVREARYEATFAEP